MGRIIRVLIYSMTLIVLYFFVITYVNSCQKDNESQDDLLSELVQQSSELENDSMVLDTSESTEVNYEELDNIVDGLEKKNKKNPIPSNSTTKTATQSTITNGAGDGGDYLVMAGSYLIKENAESMARKLKKLGLNNAEVVIFQNSEFHSVVAARYKNENNALTTMTELKSKGVDCYVKRK